jgi:hypothetical protein
MRCRHAVRRNDKEESKQGTRQNNLLHRQTMEESRGRRDRWEHEGKQGWRMPAAVISSSITESLGHARHRAMHTPPHRTKYSHTPYTSGCTSSSCYLRQPSWAEPSDLSTPSVPRAPLPFPRSPSRIPPRSSPHRHQSHIPGLGCTTQHAARPCLDPSKARAPILRSAKYVLYCVHTPALPRRPAADKSSSTVGSNQTIVFSPFSKATAETRQRGRLGRERPDHRQRRKQIRR